MKRTLFILYIILFILAFILYQLWITHRSMIEQSSYKTQTHVKEKIYDLEKNSMITIKTDLLEVKIDKNNAKLDVIKLNKHFKTIAKEERIEILNSVQNRFLETEIIDKQGKRLNLKFSTEKDYFTLRDNQDELEIKLQSKEDNLKVIKTFHFKRNSYEIRTDTEIVNSADNAQEIKWQINLLNSYEEDSSKNLFNMLKPSLTYDRVSLLTNSTDKYKEYKIKNLIKSSTNEIPNSKWFALTQHYFVFTVIIPDASSYKYKIESDGKIIKIIAQNEYITLDPGEKIRDNIKFYSGPKISDLLNHSTPDLSYTIDYGWLWFLASGMFWLLKEINQFIHNWGSSIIILTFLVKLLFYKLSVTSYRSMAAMSSLKPKLDRLKDLYGDDRQKLSRAVMKLYREEKINPLGGCLPILIQIPVFFALYYVILGSVELRHTSFLWIVDLSSKDPYFILPVLMGLSMFAMQKISPTPIDPIQAKVMFLLPVIMTLFSIYFPAGLILYWTTNNILSLIQQSLIMRKYKKPLNTKRKKKTSSKKKNARR